MRASKREGQVFRTFVSAVVIIVGGLASASRASVVCVARDVALEGFAGDGLAEAFALERRKAGGDVEDGPTLVEVAARAACPEKAVLVATLDAEGLRAGEREFLVQAIDPRDRPGEVARVLVAWALDAARDAAPDPLLDPRGRLALPVVVPRTWRVVLGAGTTWRNTFQAGSDRGAIEGELGLAWWDERFVVALEGGWEWPRETANAGVTTTTSAGALLLAVRGGGPIGPGGAAGPVILRAGVAGGLEWRQIQAEVATRIRAGSARSTAGILAAELEGTVRVTDALRVGLLIEGRFYLGGESYNWLGERFWTAPDGALSVGLRVGVAL